MVQYLTFLPMVGIK